MALYDMTEGRFVSVQRTSFEAEHVLEPQHLQFALRSEINVVEDLVDAHPRYLRNIGEGSSLAEHAFAALCALDPQRRVTATPVAADDDSAPTPS